MSWVSVLKDKVSSFLFLVLIWRECLAIIRNKFELHSSDHEVRADRVSFYVHPQTINSIRFVHYLSLVQPYERRHIKSVRECGKRGITLWQTHIEYSCRRSRWIPFTTYNYRVVQQLVQRQTPTNFIYIDWESKMLFNKSERCIFLHLKPLKYLYVGNMCETFHW